MVQGLNNQNSYPVSNTGLKQEDIQNTLAKSKEVVNDSLESNSAVKVISGSVGKDNSMYQKMLLVPLLDVFDKGIDRAIGGSEQKSLLKKFANIGDKISHILHLDNILSEKNTGRISNALKNNRFTKYFTSDFKANPISSFAKSATMETRYSQELGSHAQKILQKLQVLGETPEFKNKVASAASLSDDTLMFIKNMSQEGSKFSTEQIINAVDDLVKNGIDAVDTSKLSQLRNKLKASSSKMGDTLLGKLFSKGALKTKDTITFGGGLLSLFFTASALYDAAKAAKEAPKGEKKSTFMHVLSEQYIGLILFQPSINLLYKAGGNKYRGMDKKAREYLAEIIKNANADKTLTKEAYKVAKMQQKLLLKGVAKDKVEQLAGKSIAEAKKLAKSLKGDGTKIKLWEKPLKFFGKLLNTGLDTIKSPSKLGKIGNKLKGFLGGAARFMIILMVIQPLIQKPITKLCHKIFGEPKTYLEKNKQKEAEAQNSVPNEQNIPAENTVKPETNILKLLEESNNAPQNAAPVTTEPKISQPQSASELQPSATTSIYNNISAPAKSEESSIPTEMPEDKPAAALNLFNKKDNHNSSTYIPDIHVDNSYVEKREKELDKQVEQIIKSTDKLIKQTQKALN